MDLITWTSIIISVTASQRKMATLTEVARKFTSEPMDGKLVSAVPGIGPAISERLNGRKIYTAEDLYKKYFLKYSEVQFKQLIKGNSLHQNWAYNGMKEWHTQHGSLK